jgi:glycosyl transferase family 25
MLVQLINLDARPDRLERFAARAAEIGLGFERLAASDGSHPRFGRAAAAIPPTRIGEVVGPRGLACIDSHRRAWQAMLSRDEPVSAVLEDDVYLAFDTASILADPSWVPQGADVVRLETMLIRATIGPQVSRTATGRGVHRLRSIHMGTAGYVVTREGARRLLEGTERPFDTADRMMFDFRTPFSRGLATYQMSPAPCVQAEHAGGAAPAWGHSDILSERIGDRRRRGAAAAARHLVGRAAKAGRGLRAALLHGGRYRRIPYDPAPPPRTPASPEGA